MTRRLKVLFITPWYPSEDQPIYGVFVLEHARATQLYADVTVLCSAEASGSPAQRFTLQQTIERGLPTLRFCFPATSSLLRKQLWRIWGGRRAVRTLKQSAYQPNIIHAHVSSSALPALFAGRYFGVPVVMTVHETLYDHAQLGLTGWYVRAFVNRMHRVMPVSENLAERLQYHGVHVPLQVVPNALDLNLFYPKEHKTGGPIAQHGTHWRFLTVSTLIERKGHLYLLDALAQLRQRRQDFHLDIIGDGDFRPVIEARIVKLGLDNYVTLHGRMNKHDVAERMRLADVFVLASEYETQGCVLFEAMASGIPVVATQVGGVPEVVGPEQGRLVPPADPTALCKAIEEMMATYSSYNPQVLSESARGRYAHEIVGAQYEAIYREVLAG